MKYSSNSKSLFEVSFPLNKKIFFYGKKPKIFGNITQNNSALRENDLWREQISSGEFENLQKEKEDNYLMIPFFKFLTVEHSIKEEQEKELEASLKQAYSKQKLVYFGKLLHDMYKGLENKEDENDNGFNPIEGGFNPNILKSNNYTDIFLSLHKNAKTEKIQKFWADEYFGYTKSFVDKVKKFIVGNYTNQGDIETMDKELENSFAGFISKLVNFDDENKKQFDGFDSAMNHLFVKQDIGFNSTRSDTSYDI